MPLLGPENIQELLALAALRIQCEDCGHQMACDYCRSCDEFYWLHRPDCAMYEIKHFGHRLTIVPYVEAAPAQMAYGA
jgi:hypothetical protein